MALIALENISKHFTMGGETIKALDGISLKINEGEFVSIVGTSGSGKSTLMNILGLLDRPTIGRFLLDGSPVEDLSDDQWAEIRNQKIGFVFQSFNLLPRASALRNVEMPLVYSASYDKSFSPEKMISLAKEAIKKVGLESRQDHKPNELSGGQRQRVAVARALVNNPKILFADEPTGNLDSRVGGEIIDLFKDLHKKGVTLILVTHDPKIAEHAPRIITMKDGKVLTDRHANS